MAIMWAMFPMLMLSSVLLAVARRRGCSSRVACLAFAGLFFVLGSIGLGGEYGWPSGMALGALFMLLGIPLASVIVSVKPRWFGTPQSDRSTSICLHA